MGERTVAGGILVLLGAVALVEARRLAALREEMVAGAVVGGALWAGLAWWSGGVLASLASHILWTGCMLAFPPGAGRRAVEGGPAR